MQGGSEQKPSTRAKMWYGVQQATNAPRMNEMVRSALRARFSDFDFWRSSPSFFFLRPLIRLPMLRTMSFLDGALAEAPEEEAGRPLPSPVPSLLILSKPSDWDTSRATATDVRWLLVTWLTAGALLLFLAARGPLATSLTGRGAKVTVGTGLVASGADRSGWTAAVAGCTKLAADSSTSGFFGDDGGEGWDTELCTELDGVSTAGDGTTTDDSSMYRKSAPSMPPTASYGAPPAAVSKSKLQIRIQLSDQKTKCRASKHLSSLQVSRLSDEPFGQRNFWLDILFWRQFENLTRRNWAEGDSIVMKSLAAL